MRSTNKVPRVKAMTKVKVRGAIGLPTVLIWSGQSRCLASVLTVPTRTQIVPTVQLLKMNFNCTTTVYKGQSFYLFHVKSLAPEGLPKTVAIGYRFTNTENDPPLYHTHTFLM